MKLHCIQVHDIHACMCTCRASIHILAKFIIILLLSYFREQVEVCNTDCLCYNVSYEQYLVASSLLLLYTVIPLSNFVYTCIQLKQAFLGMGHKNGSFHWKVHPFIVLFKLSMIQNHLRNANVPPLTAPDFFLFLIVHTEFQ